MRIVLNLDGGAVRQSMLLQPQNFGHRDVPPRCDAVDRSASRSFMTAHAHKRKANATQNRARGRVLLITDDDHSRLKETLSGRNIDVVGVATGTAALISLQRTRPHLVIVNPFARGVRITEFSKMLAQSEDGIPLLLAGPEPATVERRRDAMLQGAFDYFQLPAEFDLLIERIQQLLTLRQRIDTLRADADLDHLTDLANRRRFRVALKREVERWHRYNAPCALLLVDIDHLKQINDKFGHPAGDAVIRYVAHTLREVSRDNDTAARMGGEEFALLLAGTNCARAAAAAERLREVIRQRNVDGVGRVTVSIGVAACPDSATSERGLYKAGDDALYVAKNGGRDRVAIAPLLQEKLPGV
jgi:diguanylate cyclase (GGDEF)-like protein